MLLDTRFDICVPYESLRQIFDSGHTECLVAVVNAHRDIENLLGRIGHNKDFKLIEAITHLINTAVPDN